MEGEKYSFPKVTLNTGRIEKAIRAIPYSFDMMRTIGRHTLFKDVVNNFVFTSRTGSKYVAICCNRGMMQEQE
ncbi:MAG: hypothetical protein JEY71_07340 [Sphaerochaeta sp.]|nr:hypothetical protein [Sphaerochaeta sp.]